MKPYHIEHMLTDDFYWFWLFNIPGIGRCKVRALVERFGSATGVYKASEEELKRVDGFSTGDVESVVASRTDVSLWERAKDMERKGISFVHMWHDDYPARLKNVYDAPVVLYYKGKLPLNDKPSVAVVGARNCTPYGRHMAYELCKGFATLGWQVISGLAMGIDAAAHKGCVDGGGYTCGVLGCGVDVCYPRSNIELYSEVLEEGCIMSEYAMGTPPHPGQFPIRNRIISGLADIVVVVEARAKSGSLITVEHALEQGKTVLAVPGRVGDSLSEGCNWLLKIGAGVITEAADIESEYNRGNLKKYFKDAGNDGEKANEACGDCVDDHNVSKHFEKTNINSLATEKNIVYSVLDLHPKSLDIIIEETGLDVAVVSEQLLCLQLEGLAQEISKNCYSRV